MCNPHNVDRSTCDNSSTYGDKNNTSTVIAFCLMPHVLDDAGEFCESKALE